MKNARANGIHQHAKTPAGILPTFGFVYQVSHQHRVPLSTRTLAVPPCRRQNLTMSSTITTEDPYRTLNNKERVYVSLYDHMMELF